MLCQIEQYSHFIKIRNPPPSVEQQLVRFAYLYSVRKFVSVPGVGQILKPTKIFAGRTADKKEYRFHINQLDPLMKHLDQNNIDIKQIEIIKIPLHTPHYFNVQLRPGKTARDYQEEIIEFVTTKTADPIKLVGIQTGKGKGFCSLASVAKLGQRTAVVILPSYIEKWCAEIVELLDVNPKDIMVVQGSKNLRGLISMAKDGAFNSKFIVFSSRTLQNFIESYESLEDKEYGICPDELFPLLGVGTLLIDETHQHIHAMFKILLYAHVELLIALTATLISDDRDVERIHKTMYPVETRYNNLEFDQYIDVYALSYGLEKPHVDLNKIRTQEWGSSMYSHNAFEKSILRNPYFTQNYMKIVDYLIKIGYIEPYQKGDKLIIFASSINMCDKIVQHLKRHYPQFDIRRYCEDDPYENVIDADIRVTTILSAGTALDIPGLRVSIMTNSISSPQANLQVVGRLRKLNDRDVKFYYIYCQDIKKQVDYHYKKKDLLRGRCRSIKDFVHPYKL